MTLHRRSALLLALFAVASASNAALVSVSGQGVLDAPDATVGYTPNFFDEPASSALIHGWNEAQGYVLTQDLLVDITTQSPTAYASPFVSEEATLAAGTTVNSHALYFDPITSAGATATFTFDGTILGIIVLSGTSAANDKFLASDYLIPASIPTANVATGHFNARGLEFGPETVLFNGSNSLTVNLRASNPGDQIRVITAPVPEPASFGALAIGMAAFFRRRR